MGCQEYRHTSAKDPNGPCLFQMWQEDPEGAASWMDDRALSDAEMKIAKEWKGRCGDDAVAMPASLSGEDSCRVVEIFGPLGTRDDGMPPEWIIYPVETGFMAEDFSGRRIASATFEAALAALVD